MIKTAYRILKTAPAASQRTTYTADCGLSYLTNFVETLYYPAERAVPGVEAFPAAQAPIVALPIPAPTTDLSGAVADFTEKLRWVLRAAGRRDVRERVNGVFFDAENAKLVATDGHRLHVVDMPQLASLGRSAILPRASAQTLLGLITEAGGKRASLSLSISDIEPVAPLPAYIKPQALFSFFVNDAVLQVKAIDDSYVEWQRIKANPATMTAILVDLPAIAHKHKVHAKLVSANTPYYALNYNNGFDQITIADGTVLATTPGAKLTRRFGLNIPYAADARVSSKLRPECFVDEDKFCLEADDRHVTIMNMRL